MGSRDKIKVWLLAGRPKTLPAAATPVIAGSAVAYWEGAFDWRPALAALLAALLLQIGANLANDVFDFYKGADNLKRLGPVRVTQAGLLTPGQVLMGMWVSFGLAIILGVYLTLVAGWPVVLIGLFSILAAIAYTGGPLPLGYYGLGDLTVFIFFGPVAVCGTFFVQAGWVSPSVMWAAFPVGLLTVAILVVNNLRDIESDRQVGKKTLAVRLGVDGTRLEYALCLFGAYASLPLMWVLKVGPVWILLAWFTIPMAFGLVGLIYRETGRPLNKVLAGTGMLELRFGILFAVGLVIASYFR